MRVLFIAGDPGGSRAVLPVAEYMERHHGADEILIAHHGFLGRECPDRLKGCLVSLSDQVTNNYFDEMSIGCVVFGTSNYDNLPLHVARVAQSVGRKIVHVLDSWSNYRLRLEHDGKPMLVPDIYTVMDQTAYSGALAEGIPSSSLLVAGQPALANTEVYDPSKQPFYAQQLGLPQDRRILLFVSDAIQLVFGKDLSHPDHAGFTEDQIMEHLLNILEGFTDRVHLAILPHPRHHAGDIQGQVAKLRKNVSADVLALPRGASALPAAHGVIGIASILLYQAWLMGLPCLSIQPVRRVPFLSHVDNLPHMLHARSWATVEKGIKQCLDMNRRDNILFKDELIFHHNSPMRIAQAISILMKNSFKGKS
jgi:hypothetical protein